MDMRNMMNTFAEAQYHLHINIMSILDLQSNIHNGWKRNDTQGDNSNVLNAIEVNLHLNHADVDTHWITEGLTLEIWSGGDGVENALSDCVLK